MLAVQFLIDEPRMQRLYVSAVQEEFDFRGPSVVGILNNFLREFGVRIKHNHNVLVLARAMNFEQD